MGMGLVGTVVMTAAENLKTRTSTSVALLTGSAKRMRATVILTVNVRDHLYVVLTTAVLYMGMELAGTVVMTAASNLLVIS